VLRAVPASAGKSGQSAGFTCPLLILSRVAL
jgi:hypothetical protein